MVKHSFLWLRPHLKRQAWVFCFFTLSILGFDLNCLALSPTAQTSEIVIDEQAASHLPEEIREVNSMNKGVETGKIPPQDRLAKIQFGTSGWRALVTPPVAKDSTDLAGSHQPPNPLYLIAGDYAIDENVLAIADDNTGAREIAAMAREFGLKAMVIERIEDLAKVPPGFRVVFNTNARSLGNWQALEAASESADAFIGEEGLPFIKIDSAMRGVRDALQGILKKVSFNFDLMVFVPAYPARGSIVRNGYHQSQQLPIRDFIHRDLGVPMEKIQTISLEVVEQGPSAIMGVLKNFEQGTIVVPDADQRQHLDWIAEALNAMDKKALPVGSADFFRALLQIRMGSRQEEPSLDFAPRRGKGGPVALIGTLSDNMNHQIQFAQMKLGGQLQVEVLNVHQILKQGYEQVEEITRLRVLMKKALEEGKAFLLQTTREKVRLSRDELLLIAHVISQIINSDDILPLMTALFVSGGETFGKVKEILGAFGDDVEGELEEGVPWGKFYGGRADGLPIATKAGRVGSKEALYHFFDRTLVKPVVISMGDPLGVPPISIAMSFIRHWDAMFTDARPVVVGNVEVMRQALNFLGAADWQVRAFKSVEDVIYEPNTIPVIHIENQILEGVDLVQMDRKDIEIQRAAAQLMVEIHRYIYHLIHEGKISGWARGPVNKGRINLVDPTFNSMTKDLEGNIHGVERALMVLGHEKIQVMVVGDVHQSLKNAIEGIDPEEIALSLVALDDYLRRFAGKESPRIGMAAIDHDHRDSNPRVTELNGRIEEGIRLAQQRNPHIQVLTRPVPIQVLVAMHLFGQLDGISAVTHGETHVFAKAAANMMEPNPDIPQEQLNHLFDEFVFPEWEEVVVEGVTLKRMRVQEAGAVFYAVNLKPITDAVRAFETEETREDVLTTLRTIHQLEKGPMAVFSIDPHAGEGGKFGKSDIRFVGPAIQEAEKEGVEIFHQRDKNGHPLPLPDDTAFMQGWRRGIRTFVVMYPAQAEIAATVLKALAAQRRLAQNSHHAGTNNTYLKGSDFVSAAPDEGTAEDIAWNPERKGDISEATLLQSYRATAAMANTVHQQTLGSTPQKIARIDSSL